MDLSLGKHRAEVRIMPSQQDRQNQEVVGLIGPGVELEGRIKASSGTVLLNSRFKGTVNSEAAVVVGEQGDVEAEITARTVTVTGKLKGAVHATELLEIKASGVVLGDIWTPVLAVNPGGYFEGECHMAARESSEGVAARAASPVGAAAAAPEKSVSAAGAMPEDIGSKTL
ncbi:MAG TPA: polymer-forming cytoskeletal protein [Terriglobia bacterium]|nr:polymer-forming cytoskeletal protein [Terriglobia bacterium]